AYTALDRLDGYRGTCAGTGAEEGLQPSGVLECVKLGGFDGVRGSTGGVVAVEIEQPGAQGTEFQLLEQFLDGLPVGARLVEVLQPDGQFEVCQQLVQPPVPFDVLKVLLEGPAHLATDGVQVLQDALQATVEGDPLGGSLWPPARSARKVVRGFAHQGCKVRIQGRLDEVLLFNGGGIQLGDVAHALFGVEHKHVVIDELEGVPIPRDQEDLKAGSVRLGSKGGQDVVSLVAGQRNGLDTPCLHDPRDQRDLALELRRRRVAATLVLAVLGLAERGVVRDIKRDGDVRGLLVLDQVDQHGGESVHGVGVLASGSREVFSRKGVEGPECHGMAIQDQQPGPALPRGAG